MIMFIVINLTLSDLLELSLNKPANYYLILLPSYYYRNYVFRVASGFSSEIAEPCNILDYHVASSDNFLPKFRDDLKDGTR
jgi:hypothetical protein